MSPQANRPLILVAIFLSTITLSSSVINPGTRFLGLIASLKINIPSTSYSDLFVFNLFTFKFPSIKVGISRMTSILELRFRISLYRGMYKTFEARLAKKFASFSSF